MNISWVTITYLSVLVWLLPPIRQKGTFYFSFFLVLGIADVIGVLLTKFFQLPSYDFYVIISFCLFIALQEIEYLKKKKVLFIGLGLLVICLSFLRIETKLFVVVISLLHLMIIFRILYLFVMAVAEKQAINFFYLVLAFYEFTILLKFLNFLLQINFEAQTYFYITTIFELVVGIFFTTFREDSPKLVYKLK